MSLSFRYIGRRNFVLLLREREDLLGALVRESMSDVRQEEEGQSRGEGVSEETGTLKPATSPVSSSKQELTDLAVKFLNNPRVMSHPLEAKKAFLRKKGKLI